MPPYRPAGRTSRSSGYQPLGGMPVLITRVERIVLITRVERIVLITRVERIVLITRVERIVLIARGTRPCRPPSLRRHRPDRAWSARPPGRGHREVSARPARWRTSRPLPRRDRRRAATSAAW